jgi:hypothetical protein
MARLELVELVSESVGSHLSEKVLVENWRVGHFPLLFR